MSRLPKELFSTIRRIQINTTHIVNDVLAGAYHSAFKGQGMEFEDVRTYQPGDDVRAIDWNVTARFNHPYVKSFREERELTVMIAVDVSASSHYSSKSRLKSEVIAEVGATLAFSAIKNNDRVGLLLFSDRIEQYLPPKKGTRHVLRVIRDLLAFEPESRGTDIACGLEFLQRVHRKTGVCFLISDFITDGYKTPLTLTAKKHDLITIAVTDPYESVFPDLGLLTIRDLESKKLKVIDTSNQRARAALAEKAQERLERHRKLVERVGAGYIHIENGTDYTLPIRRFFRMRERRR
ncbi:Uncharacterized protein Mb1516 [Chlamydiales bacterium SCGC AG-110-P3]|nr:Uncharacterized protein Mb1516 [Chlamydiales bacterium SCGC AG-110-P3]